MTPTTSPDRDYKLAFEVERSMRLEAESRRHSVVVVTCDGCDDGPTVTLHATKAGAIAEVDQYISDLDDYEEELARLKAEGWCNGHKSMTFTLTTQPIGK